MKTKHTRVGAFAAATYSDGSQVMIAVSAAHAFLCRKIFPSAKWDSDKLRKFARAAIYQIHVLQSLYTQF